MTDDERIEDSSRLKLVRISHQCLLAWLTADGRTALRVTGLPRDARVVGVSDHVRFGTHELVLKVWSSCFPVVPGGRALDYLDLEVHEFRWLEALRGEIDRFLA